MNFTTDFLANYLNSFRFFLFIDITHSQSLEFIVKFEWLLFHLRLLSYVESWIGISRRNLYRIGIHMKINQIVKTLKKKNQIEWTDITVETFESTKYICIQRIYGVIFRMGFCSVVQNIQKHHNWTKRFYEKWHIFLIYLPHSSFVRLVNTSSTHHAEHIESALGIAQRMANPLIKCNCSAQHRAFLFFRCIFIGHSLVNCNALHFTFSQSHTTFGCFFSASPFDQKTYKYMIASRLVPGEWLFFINFMFPWSRLYGQAIDFNFSTSKITLSIQTIVLFTQKFTNSILGMRKDNTIWYPPHNHQRSSYVSFARPSFLRTDI